ncbi:hypothetical protein [Sphingobium algorifonticola]|uniref:Uncharacterized protein n=1 Tax=Sphingobium algorifonticola TaxID=2008318 RepID=A0A437J7C0_9SPHN|nr:hypothetical protein [Sphingobium algorifonticola]RVT41055.1 hypothetical protein ENE74_11475 [Sphingobium algorifonticola]
MNAISHMRNPGRYRGDPKPQITLLTPCCVASLSKLDDRHGSQKTRDVRGNLHISDDAARSPGRRKNARHGRQQRSAAFAKNSAKTADA